MNRVAKVLYGMLFVVLLPVFLVVFSAQVELRLTIPRLPSGGAILAALGLVIMLWGMGDIWRRGRGLPMNAFPPERLVVDGIYAWVPQPIYTGFVLACLGASLFYGSATGLVLATPLVAAAATALVLGYERPYLMRTFGELPRPALGFASLLGSIARATHLDRAWVGVLGWTERLANSWSATRIGSARLINHAVFAGLAGGVGAFIVVLVSGRDALVAVWLLMLAGVLGAALVGQLMVGSSRGLSRPFGYFGGLLGITIAGLALFRLYPSMVLVLAAFCLAGPWAQAIGRLRCLVQGCCHGAAAMSTDPGIVVDNEHSRVASAGLKGTRIYPTQLYSILGNVVIAAVLVWIWGAGGSLTLVGGLYLVLAGLVRFVEEGYRGEPLTKLIASLHSYQWFALAMLVAGLLVMMLDSPGAPPITASALLPALGTGVVFFILCGFAMGVDFPESQRRFSRLSG
jgi:phosphatidylglycerol:prolipoprotein diacylglycerol transferase